MDLSVAHQITAVNLMTAVMPTWISATKFNLRAQETGGEIRAGLFDLIAALVALG